MAFGSKLYLTALTHKTLRFLLTVGAPLVGAYVHGFGGWLVYLILGALLGFSGDVGGRPLMRLGFMAVGPASVLVGAIIGTLCHHADVEWLFFCLVVISGMFYALVENRHGHIVMAARFLAYGLVFGYSVAQIAPFGSLLLCFSLTWAWLVSLVWDVAWGNMRSFSAPSLRRSIMRGWLRAPSRWRQALATGISLAAALLTCIFTGNQHAYWTVLTMLIVLHYNVHESASQVTQRITGTLIGVFFVVLMVYLRATPFQLLLVSIVIIILRWPAFSLYSGLGTACVTAFVMMLAEMATPPGMDGMPILKDRLLATFIACAFSLFNHDLDKFLHWLVVRFEQFRHTRKTRLLNQPPSS